MEQIIGAIVLGLTVYYVMMGLGWLLLKLAQSPWAPWNGPDYDDALRIEPHKDGFIRVHAKRKKAN